MHATLLIELPSERLVHSHLAWDVVICDFANVNFVNCCWLLVRRLKSTSQVKHSKRKCYLLIFDVVNARNCRFRMRKHSHFLIINNCCRRDVSTTTLPFARTLCRCEIRCDAKERDGGRARESRMLANAMLASQWYLLNAELSTTKETLLHYIKLFGATGVLGDARPYLHLAKTA